MESKPKTRTNAIQERGSSGSYPLDGGFVLPSLRLLAKHSGSGRAVDRLKLEICSAARGLTLTNLSRMRESIKEKTRRFGP